MAKKAIKNAQCCEFCAHWTDEDQTSGLCKVHGEDTELTEVCDQFKLFDAYTDKMNKLEKEAV